MVRETGSGTRLGIVPRVALLLIILLIPSFVASFSQGDGKNPRYLERIRVLGVREEAGEITVLDPEGQSRVLSEGDRVEEEDAVVDEITRSSMVLTRGGTGLDADVLIVVRFDQAGRVRVREYSKVSDSPQPQTPDSFD